MASANLQVKVPYDKKGHHLYYFPKWTVKLALLNCTALMN